MLMKTFVAEACSNIALIKYWGKADVARNLPAVASLSLTLAGLTTRTRVSVLPKLAADEISLGGQAATGRPLQRVVAMLDQLRARAGSQVRLRVQSHNDFPTAAGLASSASGFAALAVASAAALGLELSIAELSAVARQASASAARSLFGGFAALPAGAQHAWQVAPETHWPLAMLVAVVSEGPKSVGSTAGMLQVAATSPYYPAWVAQAQASFDSALAAVYRQDLEALGVAMERSTLAMHATMHTASPAVMYWLPATLAAMSAVQTLRQSGTPAWFTMDAGPHVKVLTTAAHAAEVAAALGCVPGVLRVLDCRPGPGARLLPEDPQP
jgi:diphosphomevalonate decarboxylase